MSFPITRMRRLRGTEALRRLARETTLLPEDLVAPLFVCHGDRVRRPIGSMPGHAQLSVDEAIKDARQLAERGVGGIILFGIPASKESRSVRSTGGGFIFRLAFSASTAASGATSERPRRSRASGYPNRRTRTR